MVHGYVMNETRTLLRPLQIGRPSITVPGPGASNVFPTSFPFSFSGIVPPDTSGTLPAILPFDLS